MPELTPYIPVTLSQLLDGPTVVDWQVKDIIPPTTAGVIAGDAGVGKTWLALDLALSVATGTPWLGQFPTKQGPVLIIDEENSELLLRVRLQKLLKGRGLSPTQVEKLPLTFLVGQGVDLTPTLKRNGAIVPSESYSRLAATVILHRPALTLFDSLTRVHHANENAANEMASIFAHIKALIQAGGTNCLFNHHFRKAGSSKSGDRIRGSTDLRAFFDYTLLIDRDEDGAITIEADKNRWAQPVPPFRVHLKSSDDTVSFDYSDQQKTTVWDWLCDCLDSNKMSRQMLIEAVKASGVCSIRTLDNMLKGRSISGDLVRETIGREAFYHLPDGYDMAMMEPKP